MIAGKNPIIITPLSFVPHKRVKKYVGRINLHFIRESWSVVDLGEFYHDFFYKYTNVVVLKFRPTVGMPCFLSKINPHESGGKLFRNQIYNLVSVSGDAVILE